MTTREMEPAAAPCVRTIDLSRRFGKIHAVENISLDVQRGEILCVIGLNGAGKTTLLNLMGGLLYPSKGHVEVFGLHRWRQGFEIRERSTFLPAEPVFGDQLSPAEYLQFYAQVYKLPKATFLERIETMTRVMNLHDKLFAKWRDLSLGMVKKVGLIAAFLPDVELRILDEPFAGGIDPLAMETLFEWMTAARARDETIIFSTQVLDQAEDIADRILLLHNGAQRALGSPGDLTREAGVAPDEKRALARALKHYAADFESE